MARSPQAIAEGARAFLRREYRVLIIFVLVVAVLLALANAALPDSSWLIAVSFVTGALCSGLAGFIGMTVATKANVRTTNAAGRARPRAQRRVLRRARDGPRGGGPRRARPERPVHRVQGIEGWTITQVINVLAGFSLGASSIALFARVGGGIYTKAADVGADLAGQGLRGHPRGRPAQPRHHRRQRR
jgi:K(+)-stimulated pyrophosphate-energized sodium pump